MCQGNLALEVGEVPVGAVFVRKVEGQEPVLLGLGHNATNVTKNVSAVPT